MIAYWSSVLDEQVFAECLQIYQCTKVIEQNRVKIFALKFSIFIKQKPESEDKRNTKSISTNALTKNENIFHQTLYWELRNFMFFIKESAFNTALRNSHKIARWSQAIHQTVFLLLFLEGLTQINLYFKCNFNSSELSNT